MIEAPTQYSQPHTSSEVFQMSEYTPEQVDKIMACPWSAFNQLLVFRRLQRPDGKFVTKGFGVSMALMPGTSPKLREGIMAQTLDMENPYTQRWAGKKQGEIFCMSRDLEGEPDLPALIGKFIKVTGDDIDNQHPFRHHKRVERFLSLQQQRLAFAQVVAEDAQRILDTPEFTGWSSRDKRYKGEGKVYLIEFYEEDGIVYGSCPDGSMRPVSEVPVGESHRRWIEEGLISMIKRPMLFSEGYRIGADGEDTEHVSGCGGDEDEQNRGSCSDFYEDMENEGGIISFRGSFVDGIASSGSNLIKMVDSLGRVHYICTGCNRVKDGCKCAGKKEDKKDSEHKEAYKAA